MCEHSDHHSDFPVRAIYEKFMWRVSQNSDFFLPSSEKTSEKALSRQHTAAIHQRKTQNKFAEIGHKTYTWNEMRQSAECIPLPNHGSVPVVIRLKMGPSQIGNEHLCHYLLLGCLHSDQI